MEHHHGAVKEGGEREGGERESRYVGIGGEVGKDELLEGRDVAEQRGGWHLGFAVVSVGVLLQTRGGSRVPDSSDGGSNRSVGMYLHVYPGEITSYCLHVN